MASQAENVLKDTDDGKQLTESIAKFALELYKAQGKRMTGNIFMSPLSISAVLNMAYLGARGKTSEEMKKCLFLPHSDEFNLHQSFSDLIFHLKKCSNEVSKFFNEPAFSLFMANRLYGEQSYHFEKDFQATCEKFYDANLVPINFMNEAEKSAEEINNWVSECTNQKIKDIITPDFIDSTTRLILVNAIYFKSAWKDQFEEIDTQEADFFISSQETVRVQMMFQKIERSRYSYADDLHCQIVQLPYVFNALSMFILLPDKPSSLEELEKHLTADHLTSIDDTFKEHPDVNLWLPSFKIEEKLKLKEILEDMGMKSLFVAGSADLSGIDGTKQLYASEVVHKAFVEVNEKGTEAAAATAMGVNFCCLHVPVKTVDFRADHPFLFFIREEKTKAILFFGRVIKP